MKQTNIKQAKKTPRTNNTENDQKKKFQISEQLLEKNTKYFLFKKAFLRFFRCFSLFYFLTDT